MRYGVMKGDRASILEKDLGISIRRNKEGKIVIRYTDKKYKEKSHLCFDEDEVVRVILDILCLKNSECKSGEGKE